MTSTTGQRATGLFLFSYLGFLTHLVLETLMLHFTRESIDPTDWQGIVDYWSDPRTEWTVALFAFVTLVPIALSVIADGRKLWLAAAILGGVMTLVHALHYVGELAEHFGAVGTLSLVFHVLPFGWASWLAWRCSKTQPRELDDAEAAS